MKKFLSDLVLIPDASSAPVCAVACGCPAVPPPSLSINYIPSHFAAWLARLVAGPWRAVQRGKDFKEQPPILLWSARGDPKWRRRLDPRQCG